MSGALCEGSAPALQLTPCITANAPPTVKPSQAFAGCPSPVPRQYRPRSAPTVAPFRASRVMPFHAFGRMAPRLVFVLFCPPAPVNPFQSPAPPRLAQANRVSSPGQRRRVTSPPSKQRVGRSALAKNAAPNLAPARCSPVANNAPPLAPAPHQRAPGYNPPHATDNAPERAHAHRAPHQRRRPRRVGRASPRGCGESIGWTIGNRPRPAPPPGVCRHAPLLCWAVAPNGSATPTRRGPPNFVATPTRRPERVTIPPPYPSASPGPPAPPQSPPCGNSRPPRPHPKRRPPRKTKKIPRPQPRKTHPAGH